MYRLADIDEFYAIGGEEYFSEGISIIEWGEIIEPALSQNYLKITFNRNDENTSVRKLCLEPHGKHFDEILERI